MESHPLPIEHDSLSIFTWSSIAFLYAKSIQPGESPLAPYLEMTKAFAGEWKGQQ